MGPGCRVGVVQLAVQLAVQDTLPAAYARPCFGRVQQFGGRSKGVCMAASGVTNSRCVQVCMGSVWAPIVQLDDHPVGRYGYGGTTCI